MATKALAQWAVNLTTMPSSTRAAAVRSLYNYIGVAIGGSNHPAVRKAYLALSPLFGRPTSSLLGAQDSFSNSSRADPEHASLLNGIASHVHDFDDTHLATIIHPTGPVASAVLAWAEHQGRVSGDELLLVLVAGIEASCKLGLSVWPGHYDIGWHITSTTGAVGAAVGVGKLMGLTEVQMAHAIGLAAVQVTGLREMFGSDTKSFHPGRAASNGLLAALLARGAYTSSSSALEAKRGWANVVAGGSTPRLDELVATLGEMWEIETNSFKPFPCGIVCHPAIDAAIQCHHEIANSHELCLSDIEALELLVHPLVVELTSKDTPRDGLEAKFSVFHGCAVGLLYGRAGPAEYADDIVTSKEVISIRNKVGIMADTTLGADEVHLNMKLKNGVVLKKHILHAVGSLQAPMTDDQLTTKFLCEASRVLGKDGAKRASNAAWKIGDLEDIAEALPLFKR
ncbi:hypothetical protein PV08_05128 [Exophiala spinifera]|uniref:MmgE/PrpD family protein n=1 Tax=Exophiala spinifera TaxID=91928 RepID=A0A0D2BG18_9EURO|nr:uncharacterized protein PV08_05128 [Exophiala spinifera]KIW17933.1 hypothetical protein PV08_05128 [Exophiala spinifera]